ncbi:MAG: UvrD-helicase domain-containing protein [Acetobacteraceae bacterium]
MPDAASRIVAVTFTNKAAAEMLSRIRAVLDDDAAPSWTGTFHGLGARQLRIEPEVGHLRLGLTSSTRTTPAGWSNG